MGVHMDNTGISTAYYFVYAFGNVLSFSLALVGAALCATATYVVLIYGYMGQVFGGGIFIPVAYILLACGFFAFVAGIFGFYDFTHENRFTTAITVLAVVCIAVTVIIASIFIIIYPHTMTSTVLGIMTNTLPQYGRNVLLTKAWDEVQRFLRCCAIHNRGWTAYNQSTWYLDANRNIYEPEFRLPVSNPFHKTVPTSCCTTLIDPLTGVTTDTYRGRSRCQNWQYGPPTSDWGPHNDALYYRGCYPVLTAYMQIHAKYLFLLSMILLVLSVLMTILLICGKLVGPSRKKHD